MPHNGQNSVMTCSGTDRALLTLRLKVGKLEIEVLKLSTAILRRRTHTITKLCLTFTRIENQAQFFKRCSV